MLRRRGGGLRVRIYNHFINRTPQRFSNVLVQGPELFMCAGCAINLPA